MSLKWKPGNYDGHSRPCLIVRQFETAGDNPETVHVVERLVPSLRGWLDMALTLFVSGMILGAGLFVGVGAVYFCLAGAK